MTNFLWPTRTRCEIFSNLTIKTLERRQWGIVLTYSWIKRSLNDSFEFLNVTQTPIFSFRQTPSLPPENAGKSVGFLTFSVYMVIGMEY